MLTEGYRARLWTDNRPKQQKTNKNYQTIDNGYSQQIVANAIVYFVISGIETLLGY